MRLNVLSKDTEKPQSHAIVNLACLIILKFNMPLNSNIGESVAIQSNIILNRLGKKLGLEVSSTWGYSTCEAVLQAQRLPEFGGIDY